MPYAVGNVEKSTNKKSESAPAGRDIERVANAWKRCGPAPVAKQKHGTSIIASKQKQLRRSSNAHALRHRTKACKRDTNIATDKDRTKRTQDQERAPSEVKSQIDETFVVTLELLPDLPYPDQSQSREHFQKRTTPYL